MSTLETLFNKIINAEEEFDLTEGVESFNSTILPSIDFEKPSNVKAEFIYNRFELDELTNDSGKYNIRRIYKGDVLDVENVNKRIPRFVKLTWQPVTFNEEEDFSLKFRQLAQSELEQLIKSGRVNDLRNFSGGNYFNLILKDTGVDNKIVTVISAAFKKLQDDQALDTQKQERIRDINDEQLNVAIQNVNFSLIEQARLLNEAMNTELFKTLVTDGVFNPEIEAAQQPVIDAQEMLSSVVNNFGSSLYTNDYNITDSEYNTDKIVDISKRLRDLELKATINNKYVYTLAKNVQNDSLGVYSDEFANFNHVFSTIENNALSQGPQLFELAILERSLTSVENVSLSNLCQLRRNPEGDLPELEDHRTVTRYTGYVIEKSFVDNNGNIKKYDPIVIDNNIVNTCRDREVIYGVTYHYKLSQLAELIMPFIQEGNEKFARIVIKSDPVTVNVRTIENLPPKPPQDFFIYYSNPHKQLHLSWASNTNEQRDVAKYLIFRRFSINDPFTLIGLIDFTNKEYAKRAIDANRYVINNSVKITKPDFELTSFFDDFDTTTTPIYAIVAGDVHELYSNYSIQLQVKFDAMRNRLQLTQISNSNAPLPYPNFFVNRSLFEKAIFTSNVKQIKLIFNPDALAISTPSENDPDGGVQRIVAIRNDEDYKLNIINTDLGVSRTVNINIEDDRINASIS